jgi:Xaa-Pro aminopeptidase
LVLIAAHIFAKRECEMSDATPKHHTSVAFLELMEGIQKMFVQVEEQEAGKCCCPIKEHFVELVNKHKAMAFEMFNLESTQSMHAGSIGRLNAESNDFAARLREMNQRLDTKMDDVGDVVVQLTLKVKEMFDACEMRLIRQEEEIQELRAAVARLEKARVSSSEPELQN